MTETSRPTGFRSGFTPLESLDQATADPGYFGPDSLSWRVHHDPASVVGGIRALALQSLHPQVMLGFDRVTDARDDPWGRLSRTGKYVNQITYGPDGSRQTQASTTTITAPPPSTTTTAAPTTTRATTTTVAPTTTRATTTTVVSNPAFVTTVSNTSATSQWWNGSANNGNGAWVANATFTNAYNRGQTLDLLVTRTMSDGSTTTSTSTLYVGANGSATFSLYDNTLSKNSGVRTASG